MKSVCLVPRLQGVGGMVSFQQRLAKGLVSRSIPVNFDLDAAENSSVLVVGGSRHLHKLWQARRRGVRIVQRLDGMNWLHRMPIRRNGSSMRRLNVRHFLRAEYGNWLLVLIRNHLAQSIVYQSEFARQWWHRVYGQSKAENTVIYNGVDLSLFSPGDPKERPQDRWRLLLVEGSLMGGYEMGLEAAVQLALRLNQQLSENPDHSMRKPVELMVAGRVSPEVKTTWESKIALEFSEQSRAGFILKWVGLVPGERVPELDRSAHLLYSADINAACPNSVIEAMACGLPVVAFETGALGELVQDDAGRIIAYGGNPWQLDPPDIISLASASMEVLHNIEHHSKAARERAVSRFDMEKVVDVYLQVLING